jgi:hypothetical protein
VSLIQEAHIEQQPNHPAGALLIIIFTLASEINDAQPLQIARTTTAATNTCGMPMSSFRALPLMLQPALQRDCETLAAPDIR